ncbi:replication protein C, IncQ-type [Paraburkholderia tropica]|uniref:replication protein C, IncQ-type n=1 Tax=Paraburkholderia tropica TaxID=92647 RepID=UPI002AB66090|nr:replication protein C, IncQ-type [Paraburkholderia tropica]
MQGERIVRYDPALAGAPLFQPVWRGERPKLDHTFSFGGLEWRWRGPEQLGIAEQSLLLVLMELATEQASFAQPQDEETRQIVSELYDLGEHRRPRTAELTVSFYELCRRLGVHDGGSAGAQRRSELKRLCEVTVWSRREDGTEFQSRLLTWQVGNKKGVRVLLNWRLTEVLFGGQFSAVSLNERLSLHLECARALHCALSLRIRAGSTMSFHIDKLAYYVWGNVEIRSTGKRQQDRAYSNTPAGIAQRRRRRELTAALDEISQLDSWSVKTTMSGALRISRRAMTQKAGIPAVQAELASTASAREPNRRSVLPEPTAEQASVWQIFAHATASTERS